MRTKLAKLGSDSRFTFRGQFARYGYKRAADCRGNEHYMPTLLLTNLQVQDGDKFNLVTDHLWFNLTKSFQKLGLLNTDDVIQLNGRVNDYYKGYFTSPKQRDIKLSYPSKIELVNSREIVPLPAEKNAIIGLIMNLEWNFYKKNGRPIDNYYLSHAQKVKSTIMVSRCIHQHLQFGALVMKRLMTTMILIMIIANTLIMTFMQNSNSMFTRIFLSELSEVRIG